jgi:CYTH domain-containing protein
MVMSGGYRLKDGSMPVPRRFLIASSLARLIQREGRPATRLVEAYFPPRADRTLLVRVEHGRASLILRSSGPDGQIGEEAVEVPLSHAEALVEVATGTVAFDRIALALGGGADAVLDRFILPQELDLISVTISGDPRLFAPPLWLGPEVTGEPAFAARELALSGLPAFEDVRVSNMALETLLDTLDGTGTHGPGHADPLWANADRELWTASSTAASVLETSNPSDAAEGSREDGSDGFSAAVAAGVDQSALPEPTHDGAPDPQAGIPADAGLVGAGVLDPAGEPAGSDRTREAIGQEPEPSLPDVEDGPDLESRSPTPGRRPMLRTNVTELDEGIARLARSLAPRGPRSPR